MRTTRESTTRLVEKLRERHAFEQEQMHKRLTWLGTFQAFLFAGVGIAWDKKDSLYLITIVAVLGLAVAYQGIFALRGVSWSLMNMNKLWKELPLSEEDKRLGLFGLYQGNEVADRRVIPCPEVSIPFACYCAWVAVLCAVFLR